jgi:hypothetical protein
MENGELRIIKKITLFIFHFSLYIFAAGCATKTTPVYAVVKSPDIKIADQGFLKEGFGYKRLVIYKDANVPLTITVKNSEICFEGRCISKESFIKKYFGENYGYDFLDRLLEFKCPKQGFCKKEKNKILFKDRQKKILILIKKIK